MIKKLCRLLTNTGDSSNSINWFTNKTTVDDLLQKDETYYCNEGSSVVTLSFLDNFDLDSLGTLYISNQSLK